MIIKESRIINVAKLNVYDPEMVRRVGLMNLGERYNESEAFIHTRLGTMWEDGAYIKCGKNKLMHFNGCTFNNNTEEYPEHGPRQLKFK